MLKKILDFLKGVGTSGLLKLLPLLENYLIEQIKKAEGKIGDTPEEKAAFIMGHLKKFLESKGIK